MVTVWPVSSLALQRVWMECMHVHCTLSPCHYTLCVHYECIHSFTWHFLIMQYGHIKIFAFKFDIHHFCNIHCPKNVKSGLNVWTSWYAFAAAELSDICAQLQVDLDLSAGIWITLKCHYIFYFSISASTICLCFIPMIHVTGLLLCLQPTETCLRCMSVWRGDATSPSWLSADDHNRM